MLHLSSSEKILLVMRRHWFRLLGPAVFFTALLILPAVVAVLFKLLSVPIVPPLNLIINFFTALYLMAVLTSMLVAWLSYYLDAWIVTNERIIDIEQRGLFHREISEIAMDRIQNVTVEAPGFIPTMLGFGHIHIETAGEATFTITDVPHCDAAKDIILKYIRQHMPPFKTEGQK